MNADRCWILLSKGRVAVGSYPTSADRHSPSASFSAGSCGISLSSLRTPPQYVDSQLLHPRLQRRSLYSETGGRALRSGDDPVRLLEHGNNPLPLGVIERGAPVTNL